MVSYSQAWANEVSVGEISFYNGNIHFQANKTKSKFTFSDQLGPRSLELQKCNQKLVDNFWQDLIGSVKSLQMKSPPQAYNPATSAWVKFEGVKFQVLDFEPAMRIFNKTPNNAHVLFAEGYRLCKSK